MEKPIKAGDRRIVKGPAEQQQQQKRLGQQHLSQTKQTLKQRLSQEAKKDPVVPPKRLLRGDTCTRVFTAAVSATATTRRQPGVCRRKNGEEVGHVHDGTRLSRNLALCNKRTGRDEHCAGWRKSHRPCDPTYSGAWVNGIHGVCDGCQVGKGFRGGE